MISRVIFPPLVVGEVLEAVVLVLILPFVEAAVLVVSKKFGPGVNGSM